MKESTNLPSGAAGADDSELQVEVNAIPKEDYMAFLNAGPALPATEVEAAHARWPILRRYDGGFEQAVREARDTTPGDIPAIWYVYNMGVLVKTRKSFFSIDLCHRLAPSIADELDFAIITHNHDDHYTEAFYQAMDQRHKTVISNFRDNYGACLGYDGIGGFSRGEHVFELGDVTVRTYQSDHNPLLRGFVMPVEINAGGYTILHNGDTFNVQDLRPSRTPDIWIHHAWCWSSPDGLSETVRGIRAFHPRLAAVTHHLELGHKAGGRRALSKAIERKAEAEAEGTPALAPFWGDRLV